MTHDYADLAEALHAALREQCAQRETLAGGRVGDFEDGLVEVIGLFDLHEVARKLAAWAAQTLQEEAAPSPPDLIRAQAIEEAARVIERHVVSYGANTMLAKRGDGDQSGLAYTEAIRALSPLPPGARVVVIPAEGGPEWERAMARGMDCARKSVSRGLSQDAHLSLCITYGLAAALRALTEEA